MSDTEPVSTPLKVGIEAFSSLHAEDEVWLEHCFVSPSEYEHLLDDRSVLVFGGAGLGKTAIYRMLGNSCIGENGKPVRLIVEWHPEPLHDDQLVNTAAIRFLVDQVIDSIILSLAEYLCVHPNDFADIPFWAQVRLQWIFQKGLSGEPFLRLAPLMDEYEDGAELLRQLLNDPVDDIIHSPSPESMIIELFKAIKPLGLSGVWVISDGLEGWAESTPQRLIETFKAFLSALALFERSGLAFKFFLPNFLERDIMRASAVLRRRVGKYEIQWMAEDLESIVEKRLELVVGRLDFRIKDLCSTSMLNHWLDRVGGDSPREWLDQIFPLVEYYLAHNLEKPIDEKTWKSLRRSHPPHFWMDEDGRSVRVGGREVPLADIPPKAYEMLKYLYQHSGEVIGKDQLYYLVYLGLSRIPRSKEDDQRYASPNDYAGVIDTNIYRIRKAIEPDPENPVLLQTERGHGIKLVSRW